MRVRTFTAPNMPVAMQMVREAMGEDAIIISSKEVLNGKRAISVTAAIDKPEEEKPAAQPMVRAAPDADDLRFELQNILRFHNLPELFIAKMLQKASDAELSASKALHQIGHNRDQRQLFRLALEKICHAFFTFDPLPLDVSPARLMLVGTPGIGKTLTIAKMAAKLSMDGQPITVITTDNKRAGGVEQLRAFTDILGLELIVAPSPDKLEKALKGLPAFSRVLVDTAGCNPYDHNDFKELKEYATIANIEPVLVMSSGGDSLEAIDMAETFATLPIRRLLVTQLDTARRFGSVLAAAAAQGLAFSNLSNSPSIIDSPQPADAAMIAQILLRYQLQMS